MRQLTLIFVLFIPALSLLARSGDAHEVYRHAMMVEDQFRQLNGEIELLTQGLRRDAVIVAQLTAAGSELDDFQHQVALQKALDRIKTAQRKAAEKPRADERVILLLEGLVESLERAQAQGLSADFNAVRQDLLRAGGQVQYWIFRDLQALRRVRKIYGETQNRIGNTIIDFDEALSEALAAALGILDTEMQQ